jgi:hypothetical protein
MNFTRSEDRQDNKLVDAARSVIAESFPNPDRIDCPDQNLREAVALRKVKLKQHWDVLEHVITCSPCFAEHMAIRRRLRRRSTYVKLAGIAVVATCAAFASWRLSDRATERLTADEIRQAMKPLPGPPEFQPGTPVVVARLDFSRWSVSRDPGAETTVLRPPLLQRARLSLSVQLPVLSPPGTYRITLKDPEGAVLVESAVRAIVEGSATMLEPVYFDATTAAPGVYSLTVLREGTTVPRVFPIRVE